ncbi:MAG: protein-L-isoaspartate(D-aspartate) O-methyltransferase [Candidatus Aminicenantales bacterium]
MRNRGIPAAGFAAWALACGLFFAGQSEEDFRKEREAMVRDQITARGVRDAGVLDAMRRVPRHLFVPESLRREAYADTPLPIDGGQTISQPYIVAFMTESLALRRDDRVLEIGTGSGYQAAVLACIADEVDSIEIDPALAEKASGTLSRLGYPNVRVRQGDGFFGWAERAPYDAVIVTCASRRIPPPLIDQLAEGGRLIIPVEKQPGSQVLTLVTKNGGKTRTREVLAVRFVPMTGEAGVR